MPPELRIRPVALAIVRRGEDLLVFEAFDETSGGSYYRPLGGGIEFRETAIDALRREMREELAAELADVELIGVRENIFEAHGGPGHEIVFLFSATLVDPAFYTRDEVGVVLDDGAPVSWQPLRRFGPGLPPLYPAGLLEFLLAREGSRPADAVG
jgi:ADP-ribose pyrophosphatase YjhB (NUDIX family)